jgi:DHA2 family lincomycin resistance protein-like MFS transporter
LKGISQRENMETEFSLTNKQRSLIMLPLIIGGFIALLNETLLHVAFPQLMATLNVSLNTVQWLATAYMLVVGILVPVVAFLLKTFSTKTLYLTAMILFTIGTICCGLSQSFPMLLIFRMMQGAGTGMLLPIMMNTIMEIYPPARRGAAMGMSMMVIVVAPGLGPTLSGLILQHLDWHWLFFLIVPFALLAIVFGTTSLKNVGVLTKPKIDALSVLLSTIGFGGIIFGICSIENESFFNVTVLVSLLCGIIGLGLFIKRQLALKQPMLEIRTFRYPLFALGVVLIFIISTILFSTNIILPTYIQSGLGMTPFVAGLALLPSGILNGIGAVIVGRLYDKIGPRLLVIPGFAVITVAMFFLARISTSSTLLMIIGFQMCMTLGIVLVFTPAQTNSLNQLPKEYYAHGIAVINTLQQIAAAFGSSLFIGLMGVVQSSHLEEIENPSTLQQHEAIVSGVDTAFTVALVIVAVGLVLSCFIKRKKVREFREAPEAPAQ